MKPPTMTFLPLGQTVPLKSGQSVLEVALDHKIPLPHSCGGMGSCTTCRVIVEKFVENPHPRTEVEVEILEGRGFNANERLSCQLMATAGLIVRIPE